MDEISQQTEKVLIKSVKLSVVFSMFLSLGSICCFNWIKRRVLILFTTWTQRETDGRDHRENRFSLWTGAGVDLVSVWCWRAQLLIPAMTRRLLQINTWVNSYHRQRREIAWYKMFFVSQSISGSCLFQWERKEIVCCWWRMESWVSFSFFLLINFLIYCAPNKVQRYPSNTCVLRRWSSSSFCVCVCVCVCVRERLLRL